MKLKFKRVDKSSKFYFAIVASGAAIVAVSLGQSRRNGSVWVVPVRRGWTGYILVHSNKYAIREVFVTPGQERSKAALNTCVLDCSGEDFVLLHSSRTHIEGQENMLLHWLTWRRRKRHQARSGNACFYGWKADLSTRPSPHGGNKRLSREERTRTPTKKQVGPGQNFPPRSLYSLEDAASNTLEMSETNKF